MVTSVAGPLPQRFGALPPHGIVAGLQTQLHPDYLQIKSAGCNMHSALFRPEVVDQYLPAELAGHRVVGPYPKSALSEAHVSRFGVIPKGDQPNKWR